MFRIYLNPKERRILITREKISEKGWALIAVHSTWDKAYKRALYVANKLDYVLEWYLEDQVREFWTWIYKN